jgi:hypothetical protein
MPYRVSKVHTTSVRCLALPGARTDPITSYITGATDRIKSYITTYGEEGKNELNTVVTKHVIQMSSDQEVYYCGCDIHDGALRILFKDDRLGTNINDALQYLDKAVNAAPAPGATINFLARASISRDWEPKIGAIQQQIGKQLNNPNIKLNPNWEHNYAELAKATDKSDGWDSRIGQYSISYMEALQNQLEREKFGSDDLLQEGFAEMVTKGEVCLRVQPKTKETYNEMTVEDGVLYMSVRNTVLCTSCTFRRTPIGMDPHECGANLHF